MAFPFGGHPNLRKLIEWAEQNGCEIIMQNRTRKNGQSYRALVIQKTGTTVSMTIVNPDWDELFLPTMVSNVQRRLGIKMPFSEQAVEPDKSEKPEKSES